MTPQERIQSMQRQGASSGSWAHPPKVRRSLIAGFNFPLFAGLVLIILVGACVGENLATHVSERLTIELSVAEQRRGM